MSQLVLTSGDNYQPFSNNSLNLDSASGSSGNESFLAIASEAGNSIHSRFEDLLINYHSEGNSLRLSPLVLALPPPPTATAASGTGYWDVASTWGGATIDDTYDLVVPSGATVTIRTNVTCASLTIQSGGTVIFENGSTLTVTGDLSNSGTLTAFSGSSITLSGNWINNGTFTSNSGTVLMTGAGKSVSGTSTTSFSTLQINAGSNVSSVISVSSSINIGSLVLTNGLLSITGGTTTISAINDIPQTAGLEVNGASAVLTTGNYTINNKGLIHIVQGIANFGTQSGNSVDTSVDGAFVVNGGEVNIAGRLHNSAGDGNYFLGTSYEVGLTITGGTINLATVGNGSSDTGSLDVTSAGYFDFSGGTINFIKSSSATRDIDLRIDTPSGNGTKSITGGSFVFGDSAGGEEFVVSSAIALTNLNSNNNTIVFESEAETDGSITLFANYNGLYTFQFDVGSGIILPVTIDLSGASFSAGSEITVTMIEGQDTNNANSSNYLNRYWTVTLTGITGYSYDLTAQYLDTDVVGGNEASLIEGTYNGTNWTNNGTVDDTNDQINITGLSSNLTSLSAFEAPTIVITNAEPVEICPGTSVQLLTSVTGASPYSYSWSPSTGLDDAGLANPTASPGSTTSYTVTVTDGNGLTASDGITVTVEDNEAPVADNATLADIIAQCEVTSLTAPTATDNCAGPISGTHDATLPITTQGTTVVTWTYNDGNGNSITQSQDVVIDDTTAPEVASCPSNISVGTDADVCEAVVTYTMPTFADNCDGSGLTGTLVSGLASGSAFPRGTTTVTYEYTDLANNGTATCSFTVTVSDDQAPEVASCPSNISVGTDADVCEAVVTYTMPTFADNCDGSGLTGILVSGLASGSAFPRGTTTVTYEYTDLANNGTATCSFTVTVNDNELPTISCPPSFTATGNSACTGAIVVVAPTYSDNCAVAGIDWEMTGTTTASGSGAIGAYTFGRGTTTISYTVTDVAGNENQCSYQITVPDLLTVTADVSDAIICNGDNLTLSATPLGGTSNYSYAWTGPNGFSSSLQNPVINSITTSATGTYSVTVTDTNGCTATSSVSTTVRPTPTATISGTTQVCQNASNPSVTISNPMALPVVVSYNINNGTTVTVNVGANSSAVISQPTSADGTFIYNLESVDYQSTPSCTQVLSGSATITVYPTPTVDPIATQIYCNNTSTPVMVLSGPVSGTSFTWTNSNPSIGLAASGSGNVPAFSTTNTTTGIISGTVTVTPTANGCPGTPLSYTINVNPTPTATISGGTTVCQGSTSPLITFTNPRPLPITVTYNINNGSSQQVNIAANSTSTVAAPTGTAGTFNYNLVSVGFQSAPNCVIALSGKATVVVNPLPVAVASPLSQAICSGEFNNPISLSSGTAGTSFTWTVAQTNVTGATAGSGNSISQALSTTGTSTGTVVYTITPTANTCPGSSITASVTVNPKPVVTVTPVSQTRCSNVTFANIVPTSATSGTTYDWIRDHTSDVSGMPASGTGTITGSLNNLTDAPITVSFIITPKANGCYGDPVTATVTVEPTPSIVNMSATICGSGTFTVSPVNGTDGVVPAGTTYTWAVQSVSSGVTGAAAGSGSTITGSLGNTTNTVQTVVYAVTPKFGDCSGSLFLVTVSVTPNPAITNMSTSICGSGTFTVTPVNGTNGVVPANTQYSWSAPSMSSGLTGGVAGSGSSISGTLVNNTNTAKTATYTVTPNSSGCAGTNFTVTVTVNPSPTIAPLTATVCSGESFSRTPVDGTNGIVPAGTTYTWSAPAVTGGITGGTAGSGASAISGTLTNPTSIVQTATYTVTPKAGSCTGAAFTLTVQVEPKPAVNPITETICSGDNFTISPADGTNGIVPTGTTYSWSAPTVTGSMTGGTSGSAASVISGTLVNPTNSSQTATYIVTPSAGSCDGTNFQLIVTVLPKPVLNTMTTSVCSGSSFSLTPANGTDGIIPSGTTYSWTTPTMLAGVTGGVAGSGSSIGGTLTNSTSSVQTVTYSVTPLTPTCTGDPQTVTVFVYPTPTATIAVNGPDLVCYNGVTYIRFTNPQDVAVTIAYTINGTTNASVDVAANSYTDVAATTNLAGTFNYNLSSIEYQTGPACSTSISGTATIAVEPVTTAVISRTPSGTICAGESVTFSAAIANAGTNPTYQWYLNGGAISGETGASFTSTTLNNTDKITLVVTTYDTPCPGTTTSNQLTMTVNPSVYPVVTIYESENDICAETDVSFEIFSLSGEGTSPTYEWYRNGTVVSTGASYSANDLADNDEVYLKVYSNETCAVNPGVSNTLTMNVSPNLPVSVSIAESDNPVCPGTPVTFTATPGNGGSNPGYQWKVNGVNQIAYTSTFTYTPADGDKVTVELTSNETCTSGNPATSNAITMSLKPDVPVTPGAITGTTAVCPGITGLTYSISDVTNATSYVWSVPTGWTIVSGQGSTSVTVIAGASGQNGNILVAASNDCGTSNDQLLAVTVGSLSVEPTGITVTNDDTCFGTNKTLTVTGGSLGTGANWEWFTGSCGGTSAGTGTSITVNPPAGTSTTYWVRASGDCNTTNCVNTTVTVSPAAPATPGAITGTTPVCPGTTNLTYSIVAVTDATSYTWTVPAGWTITGGHGTTSITATAGNAGQNGNITVTASNSCGTSSASTFAVVVNPNLPVSVSIDASANPLCSGTAVTMTATPTNGGSSPVYEWYVGGVPAGTNSPTYNFTPTNGQVVTAELTSNAFCATGSPATSNAVTLQVDSPITETPQTPTGDQSICSVASLLHYTVTPVTNATSYIWTLPSGWTITSGANTNDIYVTMPAGTSAGNYNISVQANNTCTTTASSENLQVAVGDYATADAGADQTICFTTSSVSIVGVSGGAAQKNKGIWSTSGTGTFGKVADYSTTYTPSSGDKTTGTVTLTWTTQDPAGSCDAASDFLILTIRPDLFATISGSTVICSGSSSDITFNANPNTVISYRIGAGATQTIAVGASGTATLNTGTLTANTTYTILSVDWAAAPSCPKTISGQSALITVDPAATVNAGGPYTICEGSPVTLAGSVGGGASSGTWSGGTGTFSPNNTTLTATYTPSAAEISAGFVTLTLTTNDPIGPCGAVSATATVIINQEATANAGADQNICEGSSATLAGSVGGGASSGTWSGGAGTFSPNNTTLTATYTPSAAEISAGFVTLTLTTDDPAGPCDAASSTMTITIDPVITVDAGGPDVTCQAASPSAITLTGATFSGGATSASWAIVSGSGTLSSTSATATPETVTFTPAANYSGTVVLSLTTDAPGVCPAVSDTRTIIVNPAPTAVAGGPDVTCQSAPPSAITLSGASIGGGATTGTWSVTSGSGTLSNTAATTSPATVTFTPAADYSGTVVLTLTTDAPGSCSPASVQRTIEVNPAATADAGSYSPICSNSSVTLNGSVGGGATTGTWSGGTTAGFNPSRNDLNAVYTPSAAEITAGSVILTLTTNDPSGPCTAASDQATITIYRAVAISSQPTNTGACVGNSADLTVVATGTGATYQWYKDGVLIPGATASTLHFASVSLDDDAGYYVVVSGTAPCSPVTSNTVTLNVDAAITISTQPVSLTRCIGTNVTFSVSASANGVPLNYQWYKKGTPDLAVGTNSSSYTITGVSSADAGDYFVVITGDAGFTCSSATSTAAVLTVTPNGTIGLNSGSASPTLCVNTPLTSISYLVGGSATGAILSGSLPAGLSSSYDGTTKLFTISGTPTAAGTYNYTVTTTGSPCSNPSLSGTITVDGVGTLSLAGGSAATSVCVNNPISTVSYSVGGNATGASVVWTPSTPAGITSGYNSTSKLFTISGTPTAPGSYSYTVTTSGSPCVNPSLSGTLNVTGDATIALASGNPNQTICIGVPIATISYTVGGTATDAVLSGDLPAGVAGSYSGSEYTISGTPTEPGSFNFEVIATGPCQSDSENGSITVDNYPDAGYISPDISTVCTTTNSGTLTLEGYSGNIIQWEQSFDGGNTWAVIPNTAGLSTYSFSDLANTALFSVLVGNTTCGNVYSSPARVTVIPAFTPEITVSGGNVCAGEPVTLTGNIDILPTGYSVISGGAFNVANPKGWTVYEDGIAIHPFPAAGDNRENGPWAETNGPKVFCGDIYDTSDNTKFSIANGDVNSWLETPIFSLPATMSSAELTFTHAYHLVSGSTAEIRLSTDGGENFDILLASYSGDLNVGNPNVINDVGVDMSAYIGMSNLQIRFIYDGVDCSVWAIDDIGLPTPPADVTYEWGPVQEIPGNSGETVVVLPPTTTQYTLTVYVAGCPGVATAVWVNVYEYPEITTQNSCVGGGTVTFTQQNAVTGGTWTVTGGGSITSEGVFTPTTAGCYEATYSTPSGDCSDTESFVVFPASPAPTVNSGCGPIVVTPPTNVDGFNIEYSFDGGATWGVNLPPTADNCAGYSIKTRYVTSALCGTTPANTTSVCAESPEVIRSLDATPPTFTTPADITISKNASCSYDASVAVTGDVTDEADNCSTGLNATYSDIVLPGACEGEVVITRYWTLVDDCGNSVTTYQTITVADNNQPPTFTVPNDITIYRDGDCNWDASVSKTGNVTDATDNCSTVLDISYADAVNETNPCNVIITRTWTVADDCGNSTVKNQLITVLDDIKPTITCPADVTNAADVGKCYATGINLGTAATSNGCTTVTVTNNAPSQFPVGLTVVTWTATDACGNSATCQQNVTIFDNEMPVITDCPDDQTVNADPGVCGANVTVEAPVATDPCGVFSIINNYNNTSDASGYYPVGETTVIWTVTDSHGNTSTCTQKITVIDNQDPYFTFCPNSVEEEIAADQCSKTNVTIGIPTYGDNCSADLSYELSGATTGTGTGLISSGQEFPIGVTTVVYTATDPAGHTATCTFTVTIIRLSIPPAVITCPADPAPVNASNGFCEAPVSPAAPTVNDPCATATYTITNNITGTASAAANYPVGSTDVIWTITDNSGKTTTCTQTVVVYDTQNPTITCQGDVEDLITNGGCDKVSSLVQDPAVSDNCPNPVLTYILTFEDGSTYNGNGSAAGYAFPVGKTRIDYTVTDASGLTATCSQTVWIKNLDAPQFSVDCSSAINVSADAGVGFCEATLTVPAPTISNPCNEVYSISNNSPYKTSDADASGTYPVGLTTVTWTISDASGNVYTCTQTVTITDTQAPTIVCPGNVEDLITNGGCDKVSASVGRPTFDDNCSVVKLTYTLSGATVGNSTAAGINYADGETFNVGLTTVTYTVTDASGLTATCSHTVWIKNLAAPQFSVDCSTAIDVSANAASGLCQATVSVPSPTISNPCNEAYSISNNSPYKTSDTDASGTYPVGVTTVTWTITDASGNVYTCEQDVEVIDNQIPTITCPANAVDEITNGGCDLVSDVVGQPTVADNCGIESLTYVLTGATTGTSLATGINYADGESFNVGVTTVTYTVTDIHGNKNTCSHTVWIKNLVAPQFSVNCSPANDVSANAASGLCEATVAVPSPTISNPCNEAFTITNDSPYRTSDTDASGTYPVGETIITWTITDASGNVYNCTQTVTITDTQAPTIACPDDVEDLITNGGCDMVSAAVGIPTYDDNCSVVKLTYALSGATVRNSVATGINFADGESFNVGETTVTYTATDASGLTATCSHTVWIKNLAAPQFSVDCSSASNVSANAETGLCIATVPVPGPSISNPCNEAYSVSNNSPYKTSDTDASGTYPVGATTFTWTITDASGNIYTCTQTVTIVDNQPPVWAQSMPADETVECDDLPALPASVTATDNCGNSVTVVYNESRTDGACPDTYTLTRTWTATDGYDNSVSHTQTITVEDNSLPVWAQLMPANVTVECDAIPAIPTIEATDACDPDVEVVFTEVNNATAGCGTITRSWTATDNCGNSISHIQTITVDDKTPPTLVGVPANVTVDCGAVPVPATVTATDVCDSDVPVSYVEVSNSVVNGCGTILRRWTATDNCGNSVSADQTITVDDTTPPTASNPTAINVECVADVPAPDVTVVTDEADNCTAAPVVAWVSDSDNGLTCPKTITRTYSVTDDCLNQITVTQTITVNDITPPVFAAAPGAVTVECRADVPVMTDLGWTDNCDGSGTVTGSDSSDGNTCPEIITRTWTYTDACGNTASTTQIITVDDTTPPTASNPTAINVECVADVPAPDVTVVTDEADNCTAAPVVAWVSDSDNGLTCPKTITRTYSVTDDCLNQITVTQTITVNDITPPVFAAAPGAVTVECRADVPVMTDLGWTDNCDGSGTVTGSDSSDGNTCPEIITRTWTYTDACGNNTSTSQTITVDDTTAPTVTALASLNLEGCSTADIVSALNASSLAYSTSVVTITQTQFNDEGGSASDNCKIASITYQDNVPVGSCPTVVTRTYTVYDACGNSTAVTQTITIDDTTKPTIVCPDVQTIPADWEENFGTVSLTDPEIADNCTAIEDLSVTWTMTGATTANGTGFITSPYQFNVGSTTVTYTVADACSNTENCSFTITITAKPEIDCAPDISEAAEVDKCSKTLDPGHPVLTAGAVPITWTWTIRDEGGNAVATGSEVRNDFSVPDISPNPYEFPVGVTTITWRAENFSGYDECTQTITIVDDQAPVLTQPDPFEDCVHQVVTAAYYDPVLGLVADRPEYFLFEIGDLDLDLDPSLFDDNCNQGCTYEVHWRITFADGTTIPADGTYEVGQPSDYDSDIQFPGDGVNYTNVVHTITYWIVDCEGNTSAPQETTITITPRPRIQLQN
ncbi:HYR domain-containing protein [Mangrovibacterium diazotrophicum]|nr:HYR domain-containing protein [Mangrovibacterium diazotrophicum]